MRFLLKTVLGAVMVLVLSQPLAAQDVGPLKKPFKPDPVRGLETATKLCASCHIVRPDQQGPIQAGIPTFMYLADKPGQSKANLADNMMHPFPPMVDSKLTVHEIKDITAYIMAMKTKGPPKAPKAQ